MLIYLHYLYMYEVLGSLEKTTAMIHWTSSRPNKSSRAFLVRNHFPCRSPTRAPHNLGAAGLWGFGSKDAVSEGTAFNGSVLSFVDPAVSVSTDTSSASRYSLGVKTGPSPERSISGSDSASLTASSQAYCRSVRTCLIPCIVFFT